MFGPEPHGLGGSVPRRWELHQLEEVPTDLPVLGMECKQHRLRLLVVLEGVGPRLDLGNDLPQPVEGEPVFVAKGDSEGLGMPSAH